MGSRTCKQTTDDQIVHLIRIKAHKLAATTEFCDHEAADIEQELGLYWLRRRSQHRQVRGDILTFADVLLNRYICNLLAARHAAKRDIRLCTASLDECVDQKDESGMTRDETYDQDRYFRAMGARERGDATRNELRIDLERVLRSLPATLQELCRRLPIQGVTEIASDMGVTRETVYAWRRRIRAAFAAAGLADYLRPGRESQKEDSVKKDGPTT